MSFWGKVLCNLLEWHRKSIVIRAGYALTKCERCGLVLEQELIDAPARPASQPGSTEVARE